MAGAGNVPRDIQESIRDALDKRVKITLKRMVKTESRGDKVLAFTPCRMFIFSVKIPSRVEQSVHFLDIQSIESKKPSQITFTVDGKALAFNSIEGNSEEMDHIITHIGVSLKQIFPAFPLERLIVKIDVEPADRLRVMQDMIRGVESKEQAPCGGFTTMYQCMCDYHSLPFREEVAWDIDTIYLSHDSRQLRLEDFDHLTGRDLIPLIAALEHNTWFRSINGNNVKLTMEACNELVKVMRRNSVIEEISLSNTGIKGEFLQKFSTALISNCGTQLSSLDLSNNLLEDKALTHLFGALRLLPCGLTNFDLSRTGVSTKCLNKVGEILSQSPNVMAVLNSLKLNDNGIKGEDFPMLYNCLAQPNTISYLDLSSTDCTLDALCDPLMRGCTNLVTLKLSKTVFTHKKMKEVQVPHAWKTLFASVCFLEYLDLSSCKLPAEALKEMLMGLSSNRNLKNLTLDLSSNEFGSAGANVFTNCISSLTCITSLDISNNAFDSEWKNLLPEFAKNKYLKYLALGRNFSAVKPKHMPDVMDALVQYIQNEDTVLESLSLADSKLKTDATYVINALGSNNTLLEIDLSGNFIGDLGARMLSKALMINSKLCKVVYDKNTISAQGFEDIAEALKRNMTVKKIPFPVHDAALAFKTHPDRTEAALHKIESYLQRNHSPHRFAPDQAYRLQQGFLISSTQQIMDRLIVKVQDTVNALKSQGTLEVFSNDVETAEKLVNDANHSRQLLPALQDIALKSQATGNPVDSELQSMSTKLQDVIEEQMKATLEKMLSCTSNNCPAVMGNQEFETTMSEECKTKVTLPKDFAQGILEGPGADIFNMTGEKNLEVAAYISDSVMEEVIDSLSNSQKALSNHLNLRRSGKYDTNSKALGDESSSSQHGSTESATKRKSLWNRKTRPQSTMGEEGLNLANKIAEDSTDLNKVEDRSSENTPRGSTEKLVDFDGLPTVTSRPLEHVTKNRPRAARKCKPSRPTISPGITSMEEEEETNEKDDSRPAQSAQPPALTPKVAASTSSEPPKAELKVEETSSKHEGKKWSPMSLIKGKTKEEKHEKDKDAKKSQSFSSSFSSIFKKKDDKRRPSNSDKPEPEPATDEKPPVSEKKHSLTEKSLEPVKEAEPAVMAATSDSTDSAVPEKAEKSPVLGKATKPKTTDRPALIPPSKKSTEKSPEIKAPTLATEEDTAIGEEAKEPKEEEKGEEGKPPTPVLPKMPAGVPKGRGMGLGALGGTDLLQEMKMKQKRFSQLPPESPQEDKAPVKLAPEANNNIKSQDSTSTEEPNNKETPNPKEETKKKEDKEPTQPSVVLPKAAPKNPVAPPRASHVPKRPLSTVEDKRESFEIPRSMTTSTPEVILDGGSGAGPDKVVRPRPPPPIKPRPPVMPRGKKSDQAGATEETSAPPPFSPPPPPAKPSTPPTSMVGPPAPEASSKPSALDAKPSAEDSKPSAEDSKPSGEDAKLESTNHKRDSSPLSKSPSLSSSQPLPGNGDVGGGAPPAEGEIVYDSATLRMSVKDKIKRLSQNREAKDQSSSTQAAIQAAKHKAMSLPKNTKLPDVMPEDEENSRRKSDRSSWKNHQDKIQEESLPPEEERKVKSNSQNFDVPDDEIMV